MITLPGRVACWQEHEDPTALVIDTVAALGVPHGTSRSIRRRRSSPSTGCAAPATPMISSTRNHVIAPAG